jgi:hypothetical protein
MIEKGKDDVITIHIGAGFKTREQLDAEWIEHVLRDGLRDGSRPTREELELYLREQPYPLCWHLVP